MKIKFLGDKMKKISVLVLLTVIVTFSCMTTALNIEDTVVFEEASLKEIDEWFIGLQYDLDQSDENRENGQITTFASAIQLLDDLFFGLKKENIRISKTNTDTNGKILLHTVVDPYSGYFTSVSITLFMDQTILGRIKIDNSSYVAPFYFEQPQRSDIVAKFVLEKILGVITQ
jgi:hypothetical protein